MLVFLFFFFSSRRRHTRFDCDWSSDVCSSDLRRGPKKAAARPRAPPGRLDAAPSARAPHVRETRSEERRVGKSVDLGGRRIIKKKKKRKKEREKRLKADEIAV